MDFDHYVREQRVGLMRFATVLTGQPWLADDVVSDVLGRAFEQWDRIGAVAAPHAYVRRMIVNDYISRTRRSARFAAWDNVGPGSLLVDDTAGEHAERDAMLERLSRLPRRQRAAVVLRYYVGMPDADIAEHLGCRLSTVRSQISRGLKSLRIEMTTSASAVRPLSEETS